MFKSVGLSHFWKEPSPVFFTQKNYDVKINKAHYFPYINPKDIYKERYEGSSKILGKKKLPDSISSTSEKINKGIINKDLGSKQINYGLLNHDSKKNQMNLENRLYSEDGEFLCLNEQIHFKDNIIDHLVSDVPKTPSEIRQAKTYLNSTREKTSSAKFIKEKFGAEVPKKSQAPFEQTDVLFSQKNPDQIYQDSISFIERSKNFNQTLKEIFLNSKPAERAEVLENFLYEGTNQDGVKGINRFNASELKIIYMQFWDLGAHDHMVEMMEHCENTYFTKNPVNLEFYAKAILKGHYFNLANAREVADTLMANPESKIQGLAILGTISANAKQAAKTILSEQKAGYLTEGTEIIYNKCFPGRSYYPDEVLKNYEQSLFDSLVFYKDSFDQSFDCRYGCRVMHRLEEAGMSEEAQQYAQLTKLAAQKEGGLKSNNLSVVRAYLESLYVLPDSNPAEIQLAEDVLFSLCKTEYQLINNLVSLMDLSVDRPEKTAFITKLEKHLADLTDHPELAQANLIRARNQIKQSLEEWELYTYNFKGVDSNYIEGNFKFGFVGMPAQLVDRATRKFFKELINTPISKLIEGSQDHRCLKEIKDFDEFDKVVNAIVRQQFHTDEWMLEQLDSEGHKTFDDSFQGLIRMSGADSPDTRKMMNSQTALQNNFVLGLGDCRHQTACKQMVYDLWHGEQLKNIISKMQVAYDKDDTETSNSLKREFDTLNATQLHTFDCEIHLPVKIENNLPVWHEGHLVLNDEANYIKVEEHTLNVQFTHHVESGELEEVTLRDTFYQNTYPWEKLKINHREASLSGGIEAGKIELYNPKTGKLETHTIMTKPTRYAGTRDLYNRGSNDSLFIGQAVKELTLKEALDQKTAINANNKAACEWFREQKVSKVRSHQSDAHA